MNQNWLKSMAYQRKLGPKAWSRIWSNPTSRSEFWTSAYRRSSNGKCDSYLLGIKTPGPFLISCLQPIYSENTVVSCELTFMFCPTESQAPGYIAVFSGVREHMLVVRRCGRYHVVVTCAEGSCLSCDTERV